VEGDQTALGIDEDFNIDVSEDAAEMMSPKNVENG
jgi:hypothetical protein